MEGVLAQKTLALVGCHETWVSWQLRGKTFAPLSWTCNREKLTPIMTLGVFNKIPQDSVSQTHVRFSTLI